MLARTMKKQSGRRYPFPLLYAFNFLKNLQFFGALAVPFFLVRLGFSYTQMFLLECFFGAAMFVFEIPTGVVADKFGRKASLVLGSLLFGGGFAAFALTRSFAALAAAEVVCAVGMTLFSGADSALVYELAVAEGAADRAGEKLSRYEAAGTFGMLLGFPAGTLFAGSGVVPYVDSLGLVFLATGVAILFSGAVVLFVPEPPRERETDGAFKAGLEGFRFIFKHPALARFSLNYAAISSMTFFMFWFYQTLLMENRFPVPLQGFVPAAFNLGATALLLRSEPIRKRFGTSNTLLASSAVPGLLYLLVAFVPGLPAALAAIFGVAVLKLFRRPLLSALMNARIEDRRRATVLSGVSMLERVLTTALYPVVGLLSDYSLRGTFLLLGSLTLAFSLFLRVGEEHLGGEGAQSVTK